MATTSAEALSDHPTEPVETSRSRGSAFGPLAVAGVASLGAGAIHAAAIGAHGEYPSVVLTFTLLAAFQLGWGAAVTTI